MKTNYSRLVSLKMVLVVASLSTLVILSLVYLSPSNHGWWNSEDFSWFNLLQFIFIDQILIECISVGILLWGIKWYGEHLPFIRRSARWGMLKYQLAFLPLALLAFFFFNPFTQTMRFLYHSFPVFHWPDYWENYFYSTELYFTYLPIVFLQLYAILNYNLAVQSKPASEEKPPVFSGSYLELNNSSGKKLVAKNDILYCEKRERKYWVHTTTSVYTTIYTISQLTSLLPAEQFVRINRAVIVKLTAVESYAFWENDKYILRIIDGPAFTMSRNRLNTIKKQLNTMAV